MFFFAGVYLIVSKGPFWKGDYFVNSKNEIFNFIPLHEMIYLIRFATLHDHPRQGNIKYQQDFHNAHPFSIMSVKQGILFPSADIKV